MNFKDGIRRRGKATRKRQGRRRIRNGVEKTWELTWAIKMVFILTRAFEVQACSLLLSTLGSFQVKTFQGREKSWKILRPFLYVMCVSSLSHVFSCVFVCPFNLSSMPTINENLKFSSCVSTRVFRMRRDDTQFWSESLQYVVCRSGKKVIY